MPCRMGGRDAAVGCRFQRRAPFLVGPASASQIKTLADGRSQFMGMIRFLQEIYAWAKDKILAHYIGAVTAGK